MGAHHTFDRRHFLHLTGTAAAAAVLATAGRAEQKPSKRFRVIDVHFHTFNSRLQGQNGIPKYMPDATIEHELEIMDRGGVDKAFLIGYNAEDIGSEIRYRGESPITMLPVINRKYQIASWKAHKDRFWFFPAYPNPIHEGFLEDLERMFDEGAAGLKLIPLFNGILPDHPAFRPLYELCKRRNKPIIADISWWYIGGELGDGWNESRERQKMIREWKSWADYGKLLDPIVSEYSTVPFSLAHVGTAKKREDYEHIFAFIARHPNVSCDLAAILDYSPGFMEQLTQAVGGHKVMYGTDVPYWWQPHSKGEWKDLTNPDPYRQGSRRWTMIAEDCNFLKDEQKQAVLAGNAERFVRNQLPKPV